MAVQDELQVWLDTDANMGQTMVVPYVKSVQAMDMHFNMEVLQTGPAGSSRINQRGRVHVDADRAVPLAWLTLGSRKEGECKVEVSLSQGGKQLGVYRFDCSQHAS